MEDLIFVSGRENLPFTDRVKLLEAELLYLKAQSDAICKTAFQEPRSGLNSSLFRQVHAINALIGNINFTVKLPGNDWSAAWISRHECLIMALRRGGAEEFLRVKHLQRGK